MIRTWRDSVPLLLAAAHRNERVIDNLLILTTCGCIVIVAIRAILMERREVPERAAATPRTRR